MGGATSGRKTAQGKTARVTVRRNVLAATGRRYALEALDTILADAANLQRLHEDMQEVFDKDPLAFFQNIAVPLMPKELRVQSGDGEVDRGALEIVLTQAAPSEISGPDKAIPLLPHNTADILPSTVLSPTIVLEEAELSTTTSESVQTQSPIPLSLSPCQGAPVSTETSVCTPKAGSPAFAKETGVPTLSTNGSSG